MLINSERDKEGLQQVNGANSGANSGSHANRSRELNLAVETRLNLGFSKAF